MNRDIVVDSIGINTGHPVDHVVNRPNGLNKYLLMYFTNPFFIRTTDGMYHGSGGEFIIHSKSFPHHHGSDENSNKGFINNWIHFDSKYLDSMMVYYHLEYDKIYKMPKENPLNDNFEELEFEFLEKKPFYRENISNILEKILLIISRNHKHKHQISSFTHCEMMYFNLFKDIKKKMIINYADKWTIGKMAKLANISESRFSILYKKFYHTSPIDDLVNRRINQAKTMLLDTNKTIDEISQLCGFSSQSYFSRIFKNRTAISPQEFRKP